MPYSGTRVLSTIARLSLQSKSLQHKWINTYRMQKFSFSVERAKALAIVKRKVPLCKTAENWAFPFLNCRTREQLSTVGHAHKFPQLKIQSHRTGNWEGLILSPLAQSFAHCFFRDEWRMLWKCITSSGDQNYSLWEWMTFSWPNNSVIFCCRYLWLWLL